MKEWSPPGLAIASLLMAGFVIAMGYGLLLPVLPQFVARLDPGASQREILWHMGLVTAVYAGAALLVAPIWGRFADRSSGRIAITLSLLLSGAASIAGGYSSGMLELYGWRFVAGLGAGAVGPSVQVWLSRWDSYDSRWRSRRVVWMGLATTAGFFIGPFVGAAASTVATVFDLSPAVQPRLPFYAAGLSVLAVAAAVFQYLPPTPSAPVHDPGSGSLLGRLLPWLLPIGTTALAVSAFEVGLSSMASGRELDTWQVGLLFAQCTLFMFAAQSVLLLPRMRHQSLKAFIIPAMLLLAAGLIATVFASGELDFTFWPLAWWQPAADFSPPFWHANSPSSTKAQLALRPASSQRRASWARRPAQYFPSQLQRLRNQAGRLLHRQLQYSPAASCSSQQPLAKMRLNTLKQESEQCSTNMNQVRKTTTSGIGGPSPISHGLDFLPLRASISSPSTGPTSSASCQFCFCSLALCCTCSCTAATASTVATMAERNDKCICKQLK